MSKVQRPDFLQHSFSLVHRNIHSVWPPQYISQLDFRLNIEQEIVSRSIHRICWPVLHPLHQTPA